jgi:hypothetical protein
MTVADLGATPRGFRLQASTPEHKLARGKVIDEMAAAGWTLDTEPEVVPYQFSSSA